VWGGAVMRAQYEQTCNRVPLHNRLEALLEETHIKLSSLVSDLLCTGARRLLKALANGETDPAALATLADYRLRAIPEQLRDALGACRELNPVYRRLLKAALEELERIEKPIGRLEQEMADLLRPTRIRSSAWRRCPVWAWIRRSRSWPQPAPVQRRFLRPKNFPRGSASAPATMRVLASVTVTAPHSPKGNRHMRRILNQAANAAVKCKRSIFQILYRRYVSRLGHKQTIWLIAHRLCRLVWKILHQGAHYRERGPMVSEKSNQRRAAKMIRELRSLGYRVGLDWSRSLAQA